jgi:hypothetical protein
LTLGNANLTLAAVPQSPEQTATVFYKWYLRELNQSRDPRTGQKRKLLGYLSKRLGKWLYSIPEGEYGADYFIDAQDFDEEWEIPSPFQKRLSGETARR